MTRRRRTYRGLARRLWPGCRLSGAGPFAVAEPGSDGRLDVMLHYSRVLAEQLAENIADDPTWARVHDLTREAPRPRCSECDELGHDRRRCPNQAALDAWYARCCESCWQAGRDPQHCSTKS